MGHFDDLQGGCMLCRQFLSICLVLPSLIFKLRFLLLFAPAFQCFARVVLFPLLKQRGCSFVLSLLARVNLGFFLRTSSLCLVLGNSGLVWRLG